MPQARIQPAVFFDRDGTLVDLVWNDRTHSYEAPLQAERVTLREGAVEAIRAAHERGYAVVVVSNQPGYAKGECSREDLDAVHRRVDEALRARGAVVDRYYYCHHHPRGTVAALAAVCDCRKPAPGLLLRARDELSIDLASSWMVGDRDTDAEAGRRAGCRTMLVPHPRDGGARSSGACDVRANDLFDGAASFASVKLPPLAQLERT